MAAERPGEPLAAGVDLLERALAYTRGSLLGVGDADLTRPTPCPRWLLGDLLDHMDDSLLALCDAATGRSVSLVSGPRPTGHPVPAVATLRDRACRLLGELARTEGDAESVSVAGRPLSASLVAVAGALEVAVHGWDVAAACLRPRLIPAPLAERLLELAPLVVTAADRGSRFGEPVSVPSDAPPGDRLVAFLGRSPRVGTMPLDA